VELVQRRDHKARGSLPSLAKASEVVDRFLRARESPGAERMPAQEKLRVSIRKGKYSGDVCAMSWKWCKAKTNPKCKSDNKAH
jgi:hypothetical protein